MRRENEERHQSATTIGGIEGSRKLVGHDEPEDEWVTYDGDDFLLHLGREQRYEPELTGKVELEISTGALVGASDRVRLVGLTEDTRSTMDRVCWARVMLDG